MKLIFTTWLYLIFLLFTSTLNAQVEPLKIKKKEFKKQLNGFQDAWLAVKDGNFNYINGIGAYPEARKNYLEAYTYNTENAELNYMIGRCYLYTDNKIEAIKYIQKAFELKPEVNFDIHLLLGMAYHQTLKFDKAISEYNNFLENLKPAYIAEYQSKVENMIQQCKNAELLTKEPKRVIINNLGVSINSVYDDYGPVLTGDGNTLYFTTRRMYTKKALTSLLDDKFFEDIYYSQLVNDNWSRAMRLDSKITEKNNLTNIAVAGVADDGNSLFIYRGKENNGDLYKVTKKNNKWKKPKPLKKFNSKGSESSFNISSNGSTLIFVSDNKKDGYGGNDIYFSKKNARGKWGKPVNAGNVVNTIYDEMGVSFGPNDSILYFSSKGHNSIGGYDIFKSSLSDVGLWSKPENLGYPINTPNDDIFYVENAGSKIAFYSTNRESGLGGMDIYKIIYLGVEKDYKTEDLLDLFAGAKQPYDSIYFRTVEKIIVDTSILMRGFITDSEDKHPVIAKIELIDRGTNQVVATSISDSTGNYALKVPQSKEYGIDIIARGYLLYLDITDLSTFTYDEVVVRNFSLDRVEVGAKVILKNVYFETGKAVLKEESFASLDNVIKLLQSNETLRIEISGHTDNTGTLKANKKLSTDRAKAVMDYLIQQGISTDRLEYQGHGFSFPVAPNTTEEGRAQNRRVEFKILSK